MQQRENEAINFGSSVGRLRMLWPDITAALDMGRTLTKAVCECLEADGLRMSVTLLAFRRMEMGDFRDLSRGR